MDTDLIMTHSWKERVLARLCSGAMAAFRKTPVRFTPDDLRNLRLSFSQFGEDLLIADHLTNRKDHPRGIYIDAGCFDPFKYSNTRLLSLLGWKGINIDAANDVVEKFRTHRPADHTVCAALSDQETEMAFLGDEGMASRHLAVPGQNLAGPLVRTTTLASVLADSPFAGDPVDLLDIDCEMHDLAVLKGFPFDKVRPLLICIEAHSQAELADLQGTLDQQEYAKLGTRGPTHIYRDIHSFPKNQPAHENFTEL